MILSLYGPVGQQCSMYAVRAESSKPECMAGEHTGHSRKYSRHSPVHVSTQYHGHHSSQQLRQDAPSACKAILSSLTAVLTSSKLRAEIAHLACF